MIKITELFSSIASKIPFSRFQNSYILARLLNMIESLQAKHVINNFVKVYFLLLLISREICFIKCVPTFFGRPHMKIK